MPRTGPVRMFEDCFFRPPRAREGAFLTGVRLLLGRPAAAFFAAGRFFVLVFLATLTFLVDDFLFAAAFLAGFFFAVLFFATFFLVDFFAVGRFLATFFLATVFLAAFFLATFFLVVFFLAVPFFAGRFRGAFFATPLRREEVIAAFFLLTFFFFLVAAFFAGMSLASKGKFKNRAIIQRPGPSGTLWGQKTVSLS